MTPRISVVVIGYNIEQYVSQCLESILNQDYSNFELIFVDDGSHDNTLSIAKSFSDDNRVKIISQENGGCVSARKAGVRSSSGEYICFIDGDDYLNHDMLTNLIKCIDSHNEQIDIATSNFFSENSDGTLDEIHNYISASILNGNEFFRLIMSDSIPHYMFPRLYRREFLIEAGYLDYPEVSLAEDLMTNAFLGLHNPCALFSETVNYCYRYNAQSLTRKAGNKLLEQVKVLGHIEEYLISMGGYEQYSDLMSYQWFSYVMGYMSFDLPVNIKRRMFTACHEKIKDFKANSYSRKLFAELNHVTKIRFMGYLNAPYLMYVIDPMLNIMRKLKSGLRNLKTKLRYSLKLKAIRRESKSISPDRIMYLMATPDYGNIGDHAIALGEKKILSEIFPEHEIIEIDCGMYNHCKEALKRIISPNSTILITGGGFIGDLWMNMENIVRSIISNYPDNKIIILPQSLYFRNRSGIEYENTCRVYRSHKNLNIILRERFSFEEAKRILPDENIFLLPDMALYLKEPMSAHEFKKNVLLCMRDDKERTLSDETLKTIREFFSQRSWNISERSNLTDNFNPDIRTERVISKLKEFHDSDLVITDRLHGMIMSVIAGTPCIAFNNLSRKVEGVYSEWLKSNIDYVRVIHDVSELDAALSSLGDIHVHEYSASYLDAYKSKLKEVIENA